MNRAHVRRYHRERAKRCYQANLEDARKKAAIAAKRFRERNPTAAKIIRQRCAKRRSAQQRGGTSFKPVNFERIRERDKMTCHICRTKVSPPDLEFDHVIPLARGGEHTEQNIAVSHRRCNRQKHTKVLTLF